MNRVLRLKARFDNMAAQMSKLLFDGFILVVKHESYHIERRVGLIGSEIARLIDKDTQLPHNFPPKI